MQTQCFLQVTMLWLTEHVKFIYVGKGGQGRKRELHVGLQEKERGGC